MTRPTASGLKLISAFLLYGSVGVCRIMGLTEEGTLYPAPTITTAKMDNAEARTVCVLTLDLCHHCDSAEGAVLIADVHLLEGVHQLRGDDT